jgi:DNA-directed RNA polymerase subunit RPC12/RpoP
MEEFITSMPKLLEDAKIGTYSLKLIRAHIFEELSGGTLRVLKCGTCGARFFVDKPADATGYRCPACGIREKVFVDKDEVDILKTTVALAEPKNVTYSTTILVKSPPAKVTTVSDATGEPGSIGKKIG